MYICGKTGTGKTHLLRIMAEQDIRAGAGFALCDPHGDLAAGLEAYARSVGRSVVYLDAGASDLRLRFNPLRVHGTSRALITNGLIDVFRKLWPDARGPRLEHLLRNVLHTLLESDTATFADIPPLLTDRSYRSQVVSALEDEVVKEFWEREFEKYSPAFRAVIVAPLQDKIGALLTDPLLRRILTEEGEQLDLAEIMNDGQVLLVNVEKGKSAKQPRRFSAPFWLLT